MRGAVRYSADVAFGMTRGRTVQIDINEVDRLRTELGWSVEDLAAAAGLVGATIQNLLDGRPAYRRTAKAIATALGVESVESILLDARHKPAQEASVHEYRIEEVLTDWVEASNGLKFQICKLRHLELDRWARGKRYDLRNMSSEDEQRCRAWFKRHPDVCYALRDHPNIVRNLTAFRAPAGDYWWIIDDWLNARRLHDCLRRGPLNRTQAKTLMLGVADGLKALHAANIIRRELNPASILIAIEDGTPFLTEFELAKLCDGGVTVSSEFWPTDPYRAPEADSDDVTFRADIYSWARVSVHALAGELPPIGNEAELLSQLRLPSSVTNVLEQSLSISWRKRPNDFSLAIAALRKWKAW